MVSIPWRRYILGSSPPAKKLSSSSLPQQMTLYSIFMNDEGSWEEFEKGLGRAWLCKTLKRFKEICSSNEKVNE